MPVAKSYTNCPLIGEPFQENGRMYVKVQASKGEKKVRWYSDAEYHRMYPDVAVESNIMDFNAKHAFGFEDTGYITLYKGKNVEEWANDDRTNIRFNLTFGYYTPGRLDLPKVRDDIQPIRLTWDEVAATGNRMRPHEEVSRYVHSLLVLDDVSKSSYQGAENEWLQETVKVTKKTSKESHFGTKHSYYLEDSSGNIYLWETGAKDYPLDATISLKMKVKAHQEIDGVKITVVWYCKEV